MKIPEGDGAFDKAWKKPCPHCNSQQILFFQRVCNTCIQKAIEILTIKFK